MLAGKFGNAVARTLALGMLSLFACQEPPAAREAPNTRVDALVHPSLPVHTIATGRRGTYPPAIARHALARGDAGYLLAYVANDGVVQATTLDAQAAAGALHVRLGVASNQDTVAASFDGSQYVVVWTVNNTVYGRRVTSSGELVIDSPEKVLAAGAEATVHSSGGRLFVTYRRAGLLWGRRFDASLAALDETELQLSRTLMSNAAVAPLVDGFHVFWNEASSGNFDVYGRVVPAQGDVGPVVTITDAGYDQAVAFAAGEGGRTLVGWHQREGTPFTAVSVLDATLNKVTATPTVLPARATGTGPRYGAAAAATGGGFAVLMRQNAVPYLVRLDQDGSVIGDPLETGFATPQGLFEPTAQYDLDTAVGGTSILASWNLIDAASALNAVQLHVASATLTPFQLTAGVRRLALDHATPSTLLAPQVVHNGQGRFLVRWIDSPPVGPTVDGSTVASEVFVTRLSEELVVEDTPARALLAGLPAFPVHSSGPVASAMGAFAAFINHDATNSGSTWLGTDVRSISVADGSLSPFSHTVLEGTISGPVASACGAGELYLRVGVNHGTSGPGSLLTSFISTSFQHIGSATLTVASLVPYDESPASGVSLSDPTSCACGPTHCLVRWSKGALSRLRIADRAPLDTVGPMLLTDAVSPVELAPDGNDFLVLLRNREGELVSRRVASAARTVSDPVHRFAATETKFLVAWDGTSHVAAYWSPGAALKVRRLLADGSLGREEVVAEAVREVALASPGNARTLVLFTRDTSEGAAAALVARWLLDIPDATDGGIPSADGGIIGLTADGGGGASAGEDGMAGRGGQPQQPNDEEAAVDAGTADAAARDAAIPLVDSDSAAPASDGSEREEDGGNLGGAEKKHADGCNVASSPGSFLSAASTLAFVFAFGRRGRLRVRQSS